MKKLVLNAMNHPLISGSAVIFIGSNLANVFNFLFNFFMARNLSDSDFGILASLNSFILLPLLVATALTPIVVNFAAEYFAKGQIDHVHGFYLKIAKYYYSFSAILLLLFLICSVSISQFLHIPDLRLIVLTGIIIFLGLVTTLNSSFLQAKLAFLYISINSLISAILKVGLGVIFVFLGMGVSGGIWAIFFSLLSLLIISFYPLRFIFSREIKASPIPTKELLLYGIPSALAILGLTLYISTDILLVKHFFQPELAGIYAQLSLIGKIIYFLTAPIITVMFPIIVQKRSKGEDYNSTMILAGALVLLPSLFITFIYFGFPEFIIGLFVKKTTTSMFSSELGYFGVLLTLYSLVGLFTNFYLSIRKTIIWIPIILAAFIQGIVIWFYHSSISQVVNNSIIIMLLLLVGLLLYYPHATKK